MDPNELSDEFEERAREHKAEVELAESAESGDMALALDDLDSVAGRGMLSDIEAEQR